MRLTATSALAALAALALLAALPARADEPVPQLTANGEGSIGAVPDIAIVTIGVTSRAATAREALDQNSTDLDKVIATVRGEKIAEKDIGTSGFSIFPVYEDRPPRPDGQPDPTMPKIVGYQVTNEVRVTIRDIASSGAILDKVVTAGANQVNGIAFDLSDRDTPADQALTDAVKDARRKAELMAEAAGVKLVRVLNVSGGGSVQPVMFRADMAMKAGAPPVPVMPGERQVTANATVTWQIAPK